MRNLLNMKTTRSGEKIALDSDGGSTVSIHESLFPLISQESFLSHWPFLSQLIPIVVVIIRRALAEVSDVYYIFPPQTLIRYTKECATLFPLPVARQKAIYDRDNGEDTAVITRLTFYPLLAVKNLYPPMAHGCQTLSDDDVHQCEM